MLRLARPGVAPGSIVAQHLPTKQIAISRRKKLITRVVERLNNMAKIIPRISYSSRSYRVLQLAPYHSLGKLPEPESTHNFF